MRGLQIFLRNSKNDLEEDENCSKIKTIALSKPTWRCLLSCTQICIEAIAIVLILVLIFFREFDSSQQLHGSDVSMLDEKRVFYTNIQQSAKKANSICTSHEKYKCLLVNTLNVNKFFAKCTSA